MNPSIWPEVHRACMKGSIDSLIELLRDGADPNRVGENGDTPLHLACHKGNATLVRALLRYGADQKARDSRGRMPIHVAAFVGAIKVVPILCQRAGCYTDTDSLLDSPALYWAIMGGQLATATALLDHGAPLRYTGKYGADPIEDAAVIAYRHGMKSLVLDMLSRGADPMSTDRDGRTLIEIAALKGDEETAKTLVRMGASTRGLPPRSLPSSSTFLGGRVSGKRVGSVKEDEWNNDSSSWTEPPLPSWCSTVEEVSKWTEAILKEKEREEEEKERTERDERDGLGPLFENNVPRVTPQALSESRVPSKTSHGPTTQSVDRWRK